MPMVLSQDDYTNICNSLKHKETTPAEIVGDFADMINAIAREAGYEGCYVTYVDARNVDDDPDSPKEEIVHALIPDKETQEQDQIKGQISFTSCSPEAINDCNLWEGIEAIAEAPHIVQTQPNPQSQTLTAQPLPPISQTAPTGELRRGYVNLDPETYTFTADMDINEDILAEITGSNTRETAIHEIIDKIITNSSNFFKNTNFYYEKDSFYKYFSQIMIKLIRLTEKLYNRPLDSAEIKMFFIRTERFLIDMLEKYHNDRTYMEHDQSRITIDILDYIYKYFTSGKQEKEKIVDKYETLAAIIESLLDEFSHSIINLIRD
jgi:hypothetical protein